MGQNSPTMHVPLLDLKPQLEALKEEISTAVNEVVNSTQYIMGPKVEELERVVAEYVGAKHGIGVSSGTDALLLALMALDVGTGDLVVTTPYSFFATAGVIARLGARPVFADINAESFNIEPRRLKETLEDLGAEERGKVKAIIPVHLYGQCADMDAILEIAGEFGIPVIEDAAQAIGAEYPGIAGARRAGSMGDMGCFSFFPSKNLGAMGDAGMITTDDAELAEKLRIKRVHGGKQRYYHEVIGGNFRLDPIQAAVLLVKLPHLDGWHRKRQENANLYTAKIAELHLDHIRPPKAFFSGAGLSNYHVYNQFVIRTPQRDDLMEFLGRQGVNTEIYYPIPFHQQECFSFLGYASGDFPESERAANESLALPIYPELTEEMQNYVVETMKDFYSAK